jgi:multiple antibiotic resistance protein
MPELALQIAVTLLIVIDPLGAVPIFISLSGGLSLADKRRTIKTAVFIAFSVLSIFIVAGRYILRFMGIQPGSFYVAGGILFFLIAIDMLFGQPKRARTSGDEGAEKEGPPGIAVFPLAIPLIAGPGMVTTIMLYSAGDYEPISTTIFLFGGVIIALAAMFVSLRFSGLVLHALGKTGVSVAERIMGLLLSGLAVQFVVDGLRKLGILSLAG